MVVIALLRLFDAHVVLLHELFGRERHCIDANERILGDIRAPVRARNMVTLTDFNRRYPASAVLGKSTMGPHL